jgi:subtilisin family serine protease
LRNNIWTNDVELNGTPGVDDDGNGYVDDVLGWDFVGGDSDPSDYYFHGTHVAGTIAALGNNGTGITGVNWYASIMPLRIFGAFGYGDTAKAIEAILYAANNGAKVINASWGGGGFSQALYDAISYANDAGCLFVAAAGNGGDDGIGDDNDQIPFYPASYGLPNIISVAATDHNDDLASFSNYGATSVDVGAPGVNIRSSILFRGMNPPTTVLSEDFESGLGDWSHWGTNDSWDLTEPISSSPTHSLADSPSGNYLDDTDSYITYNTPLNLVDKFVSMDIQLRCDLEPLIDFLYIGGDLGGGNGFLPVYLLNGGGRFSGSTGGSFNQYAINLSPLGDLSNAINLGFNLYSNSSNNDDGVYIDDIVVTTQDLVITAYSYWPFSGTSMAAPHVSGLAGLILARYPGITLNELKERILNGVDSIPSLNGKVLTNGRINACKSLTPPPPPVGGSSSGGCFIATAAFGSPLEPHVQMLRDLRDRYLLTNSIGKAFVLRYYRFSPPIAGFIAKNGAVRAAVRVGLYPFAGLRYIALHFVNTGTITLLLGMLAIVAGLFHRVFKVRRKKISTGNLDSPG